MGFTIVKNGKVTVKSSLDNLKGYKKKYGTFLKNEALPIAASILQRKAIEAMKVQFFNTKAATRGGNDFLSDLAIKSRRYKKIENRLFKTVPKITRLGDGSYSIPLIQNFGQVNRDIPHLKWQEEGTRAMTDLQPYRVIRDSRTKIPKYYAVKKSIAGRPGGINPLNVVFLKVPHPALPARNFIKAGTRFLKENGKQIVLREVRKQLNRKIK